MSGNRKRTSGRIQCIPCSQQDQEAPASQSQDSTRYTRRWYTQKDKSRRFHTQDDEEEGPRSYCIIPSLRRVRWQPSRLLSRSCKSEIFHSLSLGTLFIVAIALFQYKFVYHIFHYQDETVYPQNVHHPVARI